MKLFEELGLSNQLATTIQSLGITQPTQIQEETIPHILEGKDVIGESATGSGKTLAFGCGITEHVIPGKGLQSLILTPTRELAEQVKNAIKQFSKNTNLKIISIYGGVSIEPQINELSRAEVAIATPGRLLDHLKRRTINTSRIKLLVLDEADRMLDMGFIEDVERIIRVCPKERQTLFFSATISREINELARRYMKNPIRINAVNQVDPSKLKQVYYDVLKGMKLSLLVHLLKKESSGLAIVFCNTRSTTEFVAKNLKSNKIDIIAIHGGLTQSKRSKNIQLFNDAKASVLVCTNVASRGLHIQNVSHIYNYEIPKDPKDYVHRIGRTARAGESGKVVNLICEYDYDNFSRVLNEYREFYIEKMEKIQVEKVFAIRNDNFGRRDSGRGNFRGQGFNRYNGHKRKSNAFGRR